MLVCLSLYKKWVKVCQFFRVHAGSVGFENRLRLRRDFYKFLPIANSENLGYLHQAAAVEDTRLKVFGEGFDK